MSNGILIIAHVPLAQALRQSVLHVFPEAAPDVVAFDVQPNVPPEESLAGARLALSMLPGAQVLILTDLFGATPSNVAHKLVDGHHVRLVAGVNVPMLLRAVSYRAEPMDTLVARALAGGAQGMLQVGATAPQNQVRKNHDQDQRDHHQ